LNILTFDIEEWFHLLNYPPTKHINQWDTFPDRLLQNIEIILDILCGRHQPATFFILGWIAKKHPKIIKTLASHIQKINKTNDVQPNLLDSRIIEEPATKKKIGLGLHSCNHILLYESSPAQFRQDLQEGKKRLEDLTGLSVLYYRAPGFSLMESTQWAFQILAEEGFEADCSIFPAPRIHGGMLTFPFKEPCLIDVGNGVCIKEFPINTVNILGYPVVFSGGGYFRFWPYQLIKKWSNQSPYIMSYFHPRDFDPSQPKLPGLSPMRTFMSYTGLKQSKKKLEQWLDDFHFIDLDTAIQTIDWDAVPVYKPTNY